MRLLRIKLYQETACYQKPFAFKVGETYPLAPFSTIKGMIHDVLEAKEYIPMNISIQGKSESVIIDYQKKYMYKKATAQMPLNFDGLNYNIEPAHVTSMPMYVHLLYNVKHIIHIQAEDSILDQLYERLSVPLQTLSLGRWEDLVRVDEVTFVELTETEEALQAEYDMYIPRSWGDLRKEFKSDLIVKSYYRLPRKYEIVQGKRNWDYVPVMYASDNQRFKKNVPFDGQYPVFLIEG